MEVKKMVYKLVKEWKSPDPNYDCHEITIYRYNINHDDMIRYTREGTQFIMRIYPTWSNNHQEYLYDYRDGKFVLVEASV